MDYLPVPRARKQELWTREVCTKMSEFHQLIPTYSPTTRVPYTPLRGLRPILTRRVNIHHSSTFSFVCRMYLSKAGRRNSMRQVPGFCSPGRETSLYSSGFNITEHERVDPISLKKKKIQYE